MNWVWNTNFWEKHCCYEISVAVTFLEYYMKYSNNIFIHIWEFSAHNFVFWTNIVMTQKAMLWKLSSMTFQNIIWNIVTTFSFIFECFPTIILCSRHTLKWISSVTKGLMDFHLCQIMIYIIDLMWMKISKVKAWNVSWLACGSSLACKDLIHVM